MQPADVNQPQYNEIGRYLKGTRERLGLSHMQISRQIHIRAKYLAALEEGMMQDLPGPAYTKGYIRNYADFLGLDADELTRRYERLSNPPAQAKLYVALPTREENKPGAWLLGLCIATVIAALAYSSFHADMRGTANGVAAIPTDLTSLINAKYEARLTVYRCLAAKQYRYYPSCLAEKPLPPQRPFLPPSATLLTLSVE